MSKVIFWGKEVPFTSNDIVVVTYYGYDDLRQAIDNWGIVRPFKIIILSSNVRDDDVPILLYFIALQHGVGLNEIVFNASVQSTTRMFLSIWEALLNALNQSHYHQATRYLQEAKKYSVRLLPNIKSILSLLENYLKDVIFPIVEFSPYYRNPRKSNWYNLSPSLLKDLEQINAKLSSEPLKQFRIVNLLSEHTERLHNVFSKYSNDSIPMRFIIISSYFYTVAIYHYRNGRYGIAFLLAYRALDCVFCAMGLENEILRDYGYKIGFMNDPQARVFMLAITEELMNNGVLTREPSRKKIIESINETRNGLMYTHGVYSVSQTEAGDTLKAVKTIIRNVDDENGRWSLNYQRLQLPQSFISEFIFDAELSIGSYFIEE